MRFYLYHNDTNSLFFAITARDFFGTKIAFYVINDIDERKV